MTTTLDTHDCPPATPAGTAFRTLLETQRADCVHQREEALAECAQSVPDPVAQRRSADLRTRSARSTPPSRGSTAGTYGSLRTCGAAHPGGAPGAAALRRACVACTDRR